MKAKFKVLNTPKALIPEMTHGDLGLIDPTVLAEIDAFMLHPVEVFCAWCGKKVDSNVCEFPDDPNCFQEDVRKHLNNCG